jgi:spore coat protein CotH
MVLPMSLSLKRNYPLLVLIVVIPIALTLGLGNQRIIAYTAPGGQEISHQKAINYPNSVALFDNSLVHSIQITMDANDYQTMLTTYQQTGAKDYFHANVKIDGVSVPNVGIRLKGNASLRQALGGRGGMNRGGPDGGPAQPFPEQPGGRGQNPGRGQPLPGDLPNPPDGAGQIPPGGQMPNPQNLPGGGNFQPPAVGMGSNTQIPLLLKFDEFVSGQLYQGYDRIAIRSAGITYDASMLHEPVTNSVLRLAGLPATETAYVGVSLNGKAEQLFTLSEVIDKTYLKKYFTNANGVLYKAEVQANLNYQGEDPSAYARSFTQETRVNQADMAPLIAFLKFISEADDATFEKELPARFDVSSFATYLALNSLLVNGDSMAGMGNNFYLYYDDDVRRFTLLMWDANESLAKMAGGPGGSRGGGNGANSDIYPQSNTMWGGGRGMGGRANPLLTRFMANPTFKALYEQKLKDIYQKAFLSGAMIRQIEQYTTVVRAANASRNFVDANAYEKAVATVQNFITQRGRYLATLPLLGNQ